MASSFFREFVRLYDIKNGRPMVAPTVFKTYLYRTRTAAARQRSPLRFVSRIHVVQEQLRPLFLHLFFPFQLPDKPGKLTRNAHRGVDVGMSHRADLVFLPVDIVYRQEIQFPVILSAVVDELL